MRRGTELLLLLAIVCLPLGGVMESPVVIGAGALMALKAWRMADTDELLRLFG